jgi:hypothetical protein
MRKAPLAAALVGGAGLALAASIAGREDVRPRFAQPSENFSLPARHLPVVGDRRYTMHAGVRPLVLFWIRRDNVGSARVVFREGPNAAQGWEMTVGSDPNRAPRRINRWGYLSEERNPAGTTLVLGVMKTSDEESLEEAKSSVERERRAGGFIYKAIRSEVAGDTGTTAIARVTVDDDLTYRDVEQLLPLVAGEMPGERSFRLPEGTRGGYLGTIAEIVKTSVAWHTSRTGPRPDGRKFQYIYDAKPYEMTLTESKHRATATFKGRVFKEIIEGHFSVTNKTTGARTDFRLDFGLAADLAGIPVHVIWKPKWWIEVELVLDPAGVY